MPNYNSCLKTEVSRLAKLSNIQGGLPPLMRGLPVLAIMAGEAGAKATDTRNIIEEGLLGSDGVVSLQGPAQAAPNKEWTRPGVRDMCQRCQDGTKGQPSRGFHGLWVPMGPSFRAMRDKGDGE